jgi:uncharacterized protein YndB with AHSA1/START domain
MIEIDMFIPAPRNTVWECLTQNDHIQKWWGKGVLLHSRQGGDFYEPWTDRYGRQHHTRGTVTAIDNRQRLQIDWQDESWPKPTRVEFMLSQAEGGTKIYVQHSGWEIFDDEKRKQLVNDHREGWREIMNNFRDYCVQAK